VPRGNINIVSDARPVKTFSLFGAPRLISMQVNEVGGKAANGNHCYELSIAGAFLLCPAQQRQLFQAAAHKREIVTAARFFDDCWVETVFIILWLTPAHSAFVLLGQRLARTRVRIQFAVSHV
jgi:hypothetical protein